MSKPQPMEDWKIVDGDWVHIHPDQTQHQVFYESPSGTRDIPAAERVMHPGSKLICLDCGATYTQGGPFGQ